MLSRPVRLLLAMLTCAAGLPNRALAVPPETIPGKDLAPYLAVPDFDLGSFEHFRYGTLANWPPIDLDPPVDVLHYDLDLAFDLSSASIDGTATLEIEWGAAVGGVLHLDLVGLASTAVEDGNGTPLVFSQDASGLSITYTPAPSNGDTVVAKVSYGGVPTQAFWNLGAAAYTFTEPENSRHWFPCHDVPWDKATLTLHGRVPSARQLVSNGTHDSTTAHGSETTYHWSETHPIATYLIAVAIADYSEVPVPSAVTTLGYHVYPSDVGAAATAFQNLAAMMDFYDAQLVPYPFDKYTMVEASFGGGMEHQTATLMGQFIVTGGLTFEFVTAHELAHQWFGDFVTTGGWSHIWLNEGFATFYEALWQGDFYGPDRFASRMLSSQNTVFAVENGGNGYPIIDPTPPNLFGSLIYQKGSWVLHMLRELMGHADFDAAIVDYLNAHAYGSATTDDLRATMEGRYGASLAWFFDQWLLGIGHPQLAYQPILSNTANGWLVQIAGRQVQTTPTVFRYPLEVRITTVSGDTLVSGWVEGEEVLLSFPVSSQPLGVVLDPDNRVLDESFEQLLADVEPGRSLRFHAYPNPFQGQLTLAVNEDTRLDVFDVRGRLVRSFEAGRTAATQWDGNDASGVALAPGAYFVRAAKSGQTLRVVRLRNGP